MPIYSAKITEKKVSDVGNGVNHIMLVKTFHMWVHLLGKDRFYINNIMG